MNKEIILLLIIFELVTCIDKTKNKELLKRGEVDDHYPKKYYQGINSRIVLMDK